MAEWFIEKVMIGRILHCTCDISENENEFLLKRVINISKGILERCSYRKGNTSLKN